MLKILLATATAMALFVSQAEAGNFPLIPGPWDPGNALGILNGWITNQLNPTVTQGGGAQLPKNLLDNGDMQLYQRATAGVSSTGNSNTTLGTTEVSYGPDRWAVNVNIVTGAGTIAQANSSPTPPPGFQQEAKVYRTSGALGAPVCAEQEVPFAKAAAIAGQAVDFSVYEQALGGLAADNSNQVFLAVISGTDAAGLGLGALRGGGTMTVSIKAASVTPSGTTNLITYTQTFVAGQPVYFTAATMPTGLTSGQTYYVSSTGLTGSVFGVSSTYANAIAGVNLALGSAGTTVVVNVPYFTPVWTGLTIYSAGNPTGSTTQAGFGAALANQFTISGSLWGRIQTGPVYLATGTTEVAVLACFLPNNASSGGTTDGFAMTGAQLEQLPANVVTASSFEFKLPQIELAEAQRFYVPIADTTTGTPLGPVGTLLTTTTCKLVWELPVPMDATPIYNVVGTLATSTFEIYVAADTSTLGTPFIATPTYSPDNRAVGFIATLTTSSTAGWACVLTGQTSGAAILTWGVDF